MKRKTDNYELASKNSNPIERTVITKYELAEEKDHIDVTYILASSVPNGNGALVTKEELASSQSSIIHQPLIIVPDWDNLPTGHSLEEFPKLSYGAVVVGTHISSEIAEEGEISHLKTTARVWKIRYPELAATMMALHEAGSLKFSMESRFSSQTIEGATRTLHGVQFIGSAVVDDPANPFSYALEVASKRQKKEEKIVNFEQAMQKLKEMEADIYVLVKDEVASLEKSVKDLSTDKSGLETASTTLKDTLKEANTTIDTLKEEIATMKQEKMQAELAQKQEARFTEISQFIDFKEDEVASKKEAYGKMADDVWEIVLETAKRNKKPESSSNVEFASDIKLDIKDQPKGFLDGLE
ncbi:ELKS/Rab6-interacting/CAST family protein [Priestia megaterium]|uniref:ELKS/Rab6-interacting/CAST family protein n=1 Tax=Priestia megaterium TaxID=1404 RepID=UPI00211CEC68|nr:ELKS/Rab6-interacting/CAST family protein [Priestia megaterium]